MRNFLIRLPAWLRFLLSPTQRLVGVFLVFILLPGMFLGIFALRVLRQEGQLVRQRTHERLERIAKEIGRDLVSEFQQWEETVRLTAKEGTLDTDSFPESLQQARTVKVCHNRCRHTTSKLSVGDQLLGHGDLSVRILRDKTTMPMVAIPTTRETQLGPFQQEFIGCHRWLDGSLFYPLVDPVRHQGVAMEITRAPH